MCYEADTMSVYVVFDYVRQEYSVLFVPVHVIAYHSKCRWH